MLKTEEKSTSEKHVKKSKKEPELSLLQEVEAGQPEMFSDNMEAMMCSFMFLTVLSVNVQVYCLLG